MKPRKGAHLLSTSKYVLLDADVFLLERMTQIEHYGRYRSAATVKLLFLNHLIGRL